MSSTVDCPTVFISYSSLDKHLARRIARRLLHSGAQVIIDEVDLRPGLILAAELQRQIARSTHLIVIWTEASADSPWVAKEIEFACAIPESPPAIIPFLVIPPGRDSVVSNLTGILFPRAYRFELAFKNLLKSVLPKGASAPSEEKLRQDLAAVVQEVPSIARILRNPVEELHTTLRAALPLEGDEADFRQTSLPSLQNSLQAWRPEGVSVRSLPTASHPEYHALDFALWCASHLALLKRASLAPLLPVELNAYPGIFAKIFGVTQAGYEALLTLLSRYPGLSSGTLGQLIDHSAVAQTSVPAIVELFEEVIAICQEHPAKDQFTPYGALTRFLEKNLDRLSSRQKLSFFQLIEAHERGPYPGPPLDILGVLCRDPEFTPDVIHRVRSWLEDGLFDRVNAQTRSDSPALLYGFVAGMLQAELRQQTQPLFAAIRLRIKKLFRSAEQDKLVAALRWIAAADRLPPPERLIIRQAYSDGVFSAEFERSLHAELVSRLAQLLVDSVTRDEQTSENSKQTVRFHLKRAGFTEDL